MINVSSISGLLLFLLLVINGKASASQILSENDTLNKQYFDSISYTLYSSAGGGFVSGNNAFADKAKVQEFRAGNLCNIFGVLFNFGYKKFNSMNDSSYVRFNFYLLNGTGRNTLSNTAKSPGSIFYTDSIKIADIDTVNGNVLLYNNPLYTDSNFAIGIDFKAMHPTDSVALYTNKEGMAGNREQSWEQDLNGAWNTLKYSWPLNVDYAVFPVVNTSVGFDVVSKYKSGITLWPNPSENGHLFLDIAPGDIKLLQVYNAGLQLVNAEILGTSSQNAEIFIKEKTAGVYFVKLITKNGVVDIKKVVLK